MHLVGMIRVHSCFEGIQAGWAQGVGSLISEVASRVSFTVETAIFARCT